jgi:NAD(P)-dependent dehydrogenase (short-subunit alcohol dehydrogenase family)
VPSFARTWILDLKPRKIRVNAISPGPINTPGLDGLAQTERVGEQLTWSIKSFLLHGRPQPRDFRLNEILLNGTIGQAQKRRVEIILHSWAPFGPRMRSMLRGPQ